MRQIDGIKIIQVDGLNRLSNAAQDGTASGASLPEQAVNAALAYRVQQPLIDALLNEIGLKPGNIADMANGALSPTPHRPSYTQAGGSR